MRAQIHSLAAVSPLDLAQLRHIGINPERQSMIVVKSAVAYRAAYLPGKP